MVNWRYDVVFIFNRFLVLQVRVARVYLTRSVHRSLRLNGEGSSAKITLLNSQLIVHTDTNSSLPVMGRGVLVRGVIINPDITRGID